MRGTSLILALACLAGCTAAPVVTAPEKVRSVSPGKSTTLRPDAGAPPATGLKPTPLANPAQTSGLISNDSSTLIGMDGSTLIGMDGSTLIGNDGGSFVSETKGFTASNNGITGTPTMPKGGSLEPVIADELPAAALSTDTLRGTVRLPAAVAKPGRTDQLTVAGAHVAICKLGTVAAIDQVVVTDAKGTFEMPAGTPIGLYAARAKVKVGATIYLLAAIIRVDATGTQAIELDAGSTLMASRFEQVYAEALPALDAPGLDPAAWNAAARTFGGHVPPAALAEGATGQLGAAWAAYAKDQPEMKADDLLEAFVVAQVKAVAAQ